LITIASALEVKLLATVQRRHLWVVILARQYHETCSRQVDLRVDPSADENGKAVHEHCYVKRVTTLNSLPAVATMTD